MSTDFITYAQNAEDVVLWRALQRVDRGFYIDVGAQDPIVDSVTKAFYERGWHGINIEPVEYWYDRLVADRPHDINLRMAASDHSGTMALFEVKDTGLSTSNPQFADDEKSSGRNVREVTVPCRSLDDVCSEYDVQLVHFLKIDCEGAEKQTLEGLSLESVRPWIILVEATEPNTLTPTHEQWEHLLVRRGYEFVYFDGLNRFYVASERGELRGAFNAPPNPIEWAERAAVIRASERSHQLEDQLTQLRSVERAARAEADRDHWRGESERHERSLLDLQAQSQGVARELARVQNECAVLLDRQAGVEREKYDREAQLAQRVAAQQHLEAEIDGLRQEIAEWSSAVAREHAQYEACSVELARTYASHSWQITAPLRAARRLLSGSHGVRWAVKAVLRPPARALRPAMRKLSQHEAARRFVIATLGRDSTVVRHARLFLFGTPPAVPPEPAHVVGETWTPSHSVSSREAVVMGALNDACARSTKGK